MRDDCRDSRSDARFRASSPSTEAGDCTTTGNGEVRVGPEMVRIDAGAGSYCIDTTEVTVANYNAFIQATGGMSIDAPDVCNTAAPGPLADHAPSDQNLPVGDVGPCSAWSYCSWAGKRLCGMIGDGGAIEGSPQLRRRNGATPASMVLRTTRIPTERPTKRVFAIATTPMVDRYLSDPRRAVTASRLPLTASTTWLGTCGSS